MIIDCKSNVKKRKEKLAQYVVENGLSDRYLLIIQVGDNPASNSYIKGKMKDCEEIGFKAVLSKFPEETSTSRVAVEIERGNQDENCMGIIVQLPLPDKMDEQYLLNLIDDSKDVDGFKITSDFQPCTPLGVLSILDDIGCDVSGKTVCVVGKGKTVGKPLVPMLMDKGATVISCNSKTGEDQKYELIGISDVLISCVGKINMIDKPLYIKGFPTVIIDVGINRDENNKLCGDVSKDVFNFYAEDSYDYITPVPGGVGLYTRISLLENTIYHGYNKNK